MEGPLPMQSLELMIVKFGSEKTIVQVLYITLAHNAS